MKRDMDEDINWGKLFLKVICAFIIILLIIWLISKFILKNSSNDSTVSDEFKDNLNEMYNVAESYYEDESKLPKEGETSTINLQEMIDKGLIDTLKDGNTKCQTKSSYAKVSNNDGEYTLTVTLTCGSTSDYKQKVIKKSTSENSSNNESTSSNESNTSSNNSNSSNNNSSSSNSSANTKSSSSNNSTSSSSSSSQSETQKVDYTTMSYKFCKIENTNYYTMIYLNNSVITNGYKTTYSVKLNDLSNISKATINQDNYFLYKTDYEKYKSNLDKNFTIVGGNSAKELATNTTVLITNSLKSSNFDYKLSDIYQKDNNYYVDVEITIKKQIKNSYNNNGTKINFIPLYFSISYADLNNCVTDTYANSSKYSSYYVIK